MEQAAEVAYEEGDYARAVELLEAVPSYERSSGSLELLRTAPKRLARLKQLRGEMKQARQQGDSDGLGVLVGEYLQLRPGDEKVLAVQDRLIEQGEEQEQEKRERAKQRAVVEKRRTLLLRGSVITTGAVLLLIVIGLSWNPTMKSLDTAQEANQLAAAKKAVEGQETLTLKGHSDDVNSVSFSPDGKRIVSGSQDNTLKIWDISSLDTSK